MQELSEERERDARREAYDWHRELYPKAFGGMPRKARDSHPFFAVGQQLLSDQEDESDEMAGGDPEHSYLQAYSVERSKEAAASKWVASLDLPEEEMSFLVDSWASFHMIGKKLITKS